LHDHSQSTFRAALLDPTSPAPASLRNPYGAQATKRFDVCRNNVAVSLRDALGAAFPADAKLVDKEFFSVYGRNLLVREPTEIASHDVLQR
jgi:hypothetical protein